MHTRPDRVPFHLQLPARAALLALFALPAQVAAQDRGAPAEGALPEGGRVVAGEVAMERAERTLTVTQHSRRAILEWRSFDIGAGAAVRFLQPSSSSVVLNRVLGGDPSRIAGRLSANGHVYLVNPAGVLFAPGARVDAGQLVASTLDAANGEFLAGHGANAGFGTQWQAPAATTGLPAPALAGLLAGTGADPGIDGGGRTGDDARDAQGSAPEGLLTLDAGADGHLRIGLEPAQVQALIEDGSLQQDGEDFLLPADGDVAVTATAVAGDASPQARGVAMRDGRLRLVALPARQRDEASFRGVDGAIRMLDGDARR